MKKTLSNLSMDCPWQVVKSPTVSKTDKVKLFSEVVLHQVAELHQWQGPLAWSPSGDAKQKQVSHFVQLLKLCPLDLVI